jgi:hypothetical protein
VLYLVVVSAGRRGADLDNRGTGSVGCHRCGEVDDRVASWQSGSGSRTGSGSDRMLPAA